MSIRALFYAYVLGGLTFIPLLLLGALFYTFHTSVPVSENASNKAKAREPQGSAEEEEQRASAAAAALPPPPSDIDDLPGTRRGWLTVRRTFEESPTDGSYVTLVRGFLDARSKDPKRSRPKDMWYAVIKGKVLYLYEDETMMECEAAIELSGYDVVIFPEGLQDGELFARRNAISLKPKVSLSEKDMPSVTKEMRLGEVDVDEIVEQAGGGVKKKQQERERLLEAEAKREEARDEALNVSTPWFIFVRSTIEMEDWYFALIHASDNPANSPTLAPLAPVFSPSDMFHLVTTLDEQPDVIPMRWLNALIGRIFFSYYRTQALETFIINRLMKKISKIKRPALLTDIVVSGVSVGNKAPMFSKPMLKELTKEGDASLELHLLYKGEVRVTVEATATINLGARFKTYTVKLVLALVLREIEGNLLVKVKRPPSSRLWYAFTQMPRIVLDVEPVVSDRQITWGMILSTIESKVKETILESVVLPNMDDITFFESSAYEHRGGIWADASRREPQSSVFTSPAPPPDDTRSATSVPVPDIPSLDSELPNVKRSQSAEGPRADANAPAGLTLSRPATTSVEATTPLTSPGRRRTWFGGPRDEPEELGAGLLNTEEGDDDTLRGRSRTADSPIPISRLSSSTPSEGFVAPRPSSAGSQHLAPETRRRASSHHSQSSTFRDGSSAGGDSDVDAESNAAANRSDASQANGSSRNSGNASSFLQTLRSRATDKQALSNTAKEAMRKWGVNWSNLRRDNHANASQAADEVSDSSSGDQPHQSDSRYKTHSNYDEVRAAVEQRSRRGPSHTEATEGQSSEPVAIPQGHDRERSRSTSYAGQGNGGLNVRAKTAPASRSVSPRPMAVPALQPGSSSPALPIRKTESSTSSASHEIPVIVSDESESPPAPIHTQPPQSNKMMTIPGIHASHRGEVMSMGYAPPSPPAAPETKKPPAIQSVYRLWKNSNGTTTTQQPQTALSDGQGQAHPHPQSGTSATEQDASTSTQPPPAADAPSRPTPPPLPPRAIPAYAKPETPLLPSEPSTEQTKSPASAALQSIAAKDRTKRASLTPPASASTSPRLADDPSTPPRSPELPPSRPSPQPPALPPRRMRTNA